jgi:hypothetical protein
MNDSWHYVKTQIETIWNNANFEDTELKRARGDLKKMVDLIHRKTGEPRIEIMQKMSAII